MPLWKHILLSVYLRVSGPARRRALRRAATADGAPQAILVFHRIADDRANEWTTPTAEFAKAVRWLKRSCDLISLAEVQRRMRGGGCRRPGVAITFDDGYADNCRVALPLLIAERIPCTYFVTSRPILEGVPFEHDLEMGNPLRPNSLEELKELARAGIEIGAHTRTHADLARVRGELFDELVASRDDLEEALGQRIRYFAFPFGQHENLSVEAFRLAREAGYDGVCSAYGRYNLPGDDPFHLQRRCVDGPVARTKNWASIDLIRSRRIPRFEIGGTEPAPRGAAVGGSA